VLARADPDKPFVVETDASDYSVGCVMSLRDEQGNLRPVAFHSRWSLKSAESYPIQDKELLAIVVALKTWRHHHEGARHKVSVFTDHRNLEHMASIAVSSSRQARWSLFLSRFDFELTHVRNRYEQRARKRAVATPRPHVGCRSLRGHPLLPDGCVVGALDNALLRDASSEWGDIDDDVAHPPALAAEMACAIQVAASGDSEFVKGRNGSSVVFARPGSGMVLREGKHYLPAGEPRTLALGRAHDSRVGAHFDARRTLELVRCLYWWPRMRATVKEYAASCLTCAHNKAPGTRPQGLLRPLPTPDRTWRSVPVYFITDLPASGGCTCVIVAVDKLTKMVGVLVDEDAQHVRLGGESACSARHGTLAPSARFISQSNPGRCAGSDLAFDSL
jgi:hypothetical protein